MKIEAMRPGQRDCYHLNMRLIEEGKLFIANVLPTRYGKSDVMRMLAISAKEQNHVGLSLALSPTAVLRDQLVDKRRLAQMRKRYNLTAIQTKGMRQLKMAEYRPGTNDEALLSTTIQYVQRNIYEIIQMAKYTRSRTGCPLLLLIDECHTASDENTWGTAIQAIVNDGNAIAALFTATPVRTSGEAIPGFTFEVLEEEAASKYVVTDAGDEIHNIVDVYDGTKQLVRLKADYDETSFRDAWNEDVLCRLTRDVIDTDVSRFLSGNTVNTQLSLLTKTQARTVLSRAIRDKEVIRSGVRMMLADLQVIREIIPNAAAIVFTGNDEEATKRDSDHAKIIREMIEEEQTSYGLTLDCKIATLKTSTAEERADQIVKRFADEDNPRGDVLIVKQMAGAGLDCARLKVLLDLSSVRTIPSCIQRWMRVATPHAGMRIGRVIMLGDCLARALWDRFVRDEGGEIPGDWNFANLEFRERYLVEKKDEDDKPAWAIGSPALAGYTDSDGRVGDLALHPRVQHWKRAFPILGTQYTDPQIAEGIARIEAGEYDFQNGTTTAEEIQGLYDTCNALVTELMKAYVAQHGYESRKYEAKRKDIWNTARKRINWPVGADGKFLELQSITDLETLRSLKRAITEMCE